MRLGPSCIDRAAALRLALSAAVLPLAPLRTSAAEKFAYQPALEGKGCIHAVARILAQAARC
jgi:hypothetical protein